MQPVNITGFLLPIDYDGSPVYYSPYTTEYISTEQQAQISREIAADIEEQLRTECAQAMHAMRATVRGKKAKNPVGGRKKAKTTRRTGKKQSDG